MNRPSTLTLDLFDLDMGDEKEKCGQGLIDRSREGEQESLWREKFEQKGTLGREEGGRLRQGKKLDTEAEDDKLKKGEKIVIETKQMICKRTGLSLEKDNGVCEEMTGGKRRCEQFSRKKQQLNNSEYLTLSDSRERLESPRSCAFHFKTGAANSDRGGQGKFCKQTKFKQIGLIGLFIVLMRSF